MVNSRALGPRMDGSSWHRSGIFAVTLALSTTNKVGMGLVGPWSEVQPKNAIGVKTENGDAALEKRDACASPGEEQRLRGVGYRTPPSLHGSLKWMDSARVSSIE